MTDAGSACGEDTVNGANGTLDGVSIVEGHEMAEVITDPLLNAWFDSSGFEIGDSARGPASRTSPPRPGPFVVQPLWSNAISNCALASASASELSAGQSLPAG